MKVHFTATSQDLETHLEEYSEIISIITAHGHTLARDWIDEDLQQKRNGIEYTRDEYREIWLKVKAAIMSADMVIIDSSQNTFSLGYQTAFSLINKKPTLVLSKNKEISDTIVTGEDNPLLQIELYTPAEGPKKIIEAFLEKYSGQRQDMRFNMMLDRETQVFLELESYQTGKTKARIIRDLIRNDIAQKNRLI